MITEAQQRLAHWIASEGFWTYTGVVELMEKNNATVAQLKAVAEETKQAFSQDGLQRAYCFARLVSDANLSKFATAFLMYARQAYVPSYKEEVAKLNAKVRDQGIDTSTETRERLLAERDAFMADRREKCMKDDPFYGEWQAKQEERRIAVAFMKSDGKDYEAFKADWKGSR